MMLKFQNNVLTLINPSLSARPVYRTFPSESKDNAKLLAQTILTNDTFDDFSEIFKNLQM